MDRVRALATALGTLELAQRLSWIPQRAAPGQFDTAPPSDIQFDVDRYVPPPTVIDGIPLRFPPVHTIFATAALSGTPTRRDQHLLADALATIEQTYPYLPGGVFTHVAYGLPYFRRLPAGLVALHLPRLLSDTSRFVLEEALPAPTDVHPANPGVRKLRFQVRVRIDGDDLLFTLRGDNPRYLTDVLTWLDGSDELAGAPTPSPRLDAPLRFTSCRVMFVQSGLPRKIAADQAMPFAFMVNPRSPVWMSLDDQPANPPAPAVTFRGTTGLRLTTAQTGDYFDNGAIQQLSHEILDLHQFYDVDDPVFLERVRCLFGSAPPCPVLADATPRHGARHGGRPMAGLSTLHRSLATGDDQPPRRNIDGPGFDDLDVPGRRLQPKLQSSVFAPTSDPRQHHAAGRPAATDATGLERFRTATRRQNFLVPPRRHRAFPLLELA